MYSSIDLTKLGGLYVYQNTLDILQAAYSGSLSAISTLLGDYLILTGVSDNGSTITDGWVIIDGEILPFVGGTKQTYCNVEIITTAEQFADGTSKNVYNTKRVVLTGTASSGTFNFSDLNTLALTDETLQKAAQNIRDTLSSMFFNEAVILSGCTLSNVDIVASTCKIAAGKVMIDGNVLATAQYNGAYPVWMNNAGGFVSSQPATGSFIKFDYETSQRYADVVKRNAHGSGEIVMSRSAVDLGLFDLATGLGKWKWLGWKICDVMMSRVPLGFDRRSSNPGGADSGAWSNDNRTLSNSIGANTHTLTDNEINHSHSMNGVQGDGTTGYGAINPSSDVGNHENINDVLHTGERTIEYNGDSNGVRSAMDLRQSSRVILFIEKI